MAFAFIKNMFSGTGKPKAPSSAQVVSTNFSGLTRGQQEVFDLVQQGRNIYLTGMAGTGKSYVLEKIITWAKASGKNVIVCAPTGIAALNVGGTTLHRALGIRPETTLELETFAFLAKDSPIKACDLMIVDEISMCRLDLFDYLSSALEKAAFVRARSGRLRCQLVVVGDFCQLPPVIPTRERTILNQKYGRDIGGGYAFMSNSWSTWDFVSVELTEAIRQRDRDFVCALNMARVGDMDGVAWIQEHSAKAALPGAIFLTGHNNDVDAENKRRLRELRGKETTYQAETRGEVSGKDKPTADQLTLKPGARVMALVNDSETTYMNGSLGTVVKCKPESVVVEFDGLGTTEVFAHEWNITVPTLVDGQTATETIGTFKQIPLKLAWAITIHKSQGQTFEAANINPSCWDNGQLYTALSRLTNVEHLYLTHAIDDSFLKTSPDVIRFLRESGQEPDALDAPSTPVPEAADRATAAQHFAAPEHEGVNSAPSSPAQHTRTISSEGQRSKHRPNPDANF